MEDSTPVPRRERARAIRQRHGYDGELTHVMLDELAPLLREPIEQRYIETLPATKGKPYESTGIRSVQVQVDRLEEVLGLAHFRLLAWHVPDGTRCRVHALIGNHLQWARIDVGTGELTPYTEVASIGRSADILAQADGWGGHNRGSAPGDMHKGSETNAAKRVIARLGPGDHVYRLDFEDHPEAGREVAPVVPAEPPPLPLTDERARRQRATAEALYDEIRQLGGGRGAYALPPGTYHAYLLRAQHDHQRLDDFIGWLEDRHEQLAREFEEAQT